MTLALRNGPEMSIAAFSFLAFFLVSTAAWPQQPASAAGKAAVAERVKRDSARCAANADLDACDDALRWNPGDPALLVASGDALLRADRPVDAIRHYHRAAALAPNSHGLAAKISAAEKRLAADRLAARRAAALVSSRRYSNADPETQSH
jgi:predicted Zn-dependent protease